MTEDFKLRYTNGFANYSGDIKENSLEIDGECKITNYDPNESSGKKKGQITINFSEESLTIEDGTGNALKSREKANFSNKKYTIFSELAALDGNSQELSVDDIEKLDKSYIEKWGLKDLQLNLEKGVVTLIWGQNDILRIDFETWQEKADKYYNDIKEYISTLASKVYKYFFDDETEKTIKTEKTNVNLSDYYNNNNFKVIPAEVHTVTGKNSDDSPYLYSAVIGVTLDRLKEANPNINMDWKREIGSTYIIPEKYLIKPGSVKSIDDIAKIVGVSPSFIKDIIFGLEGREEKSPFLKPYYDKVPGKKSRKGVITIGYGHTNRIAGKYIKGCKNPEQLFEMNSKNMGKIEIKKEDAYEILAQDLLTAKMDALLYFGEDLLKAPQSIQDAVVDIVFNKGTDLGLKKNGLDATENELFKNILNEDYAEAAKNTLYPTKNVGLKKRNVYRFITALKDLSKSDRQKAMEEFKPYFEEVKHQLKNKGVEAQILQHACSNAINGICEGFFE